VFSVRYELRPKKKLKIIRSQIRMRVLVRVFVVLSTSFMEPYTSLP